MSVPWVPDFLIGSDQTILWEASAVALSESRLSVAHLPTQSETAPHRSSSLRLQERGNPDTLGRVSAAELAVSLGRRTPHPPERRPLDYPKGTRRGNDPMIPSENRQWMGCRARATFELGTVTSESGLRSGAQTRRALDTPVSDSEGSEVGQRRHSYPVTAVALRVLVLQDPVLLSTNLTPIMDSIHAGPKWRKGSPLLLAEFLGRDNTAPRLKSRRSSSADWLAGSGNLLLAVSRYRGVTRLGSTCSS